MFSQTLPPNRNADFTGNPRLGEDFYIPLLFYDPVSFSQDIELKKKIFLSKSNQIHKNRILIKGSVTQLKIEESLKPTYQTYLPNILITKRYCHLQLALPKPLSIYGHQMNH